MRRVRLSARVRANRANAQLSTGPRTAHGMARVAQNAVIHGLARTQAPGPSPREVDEMAGLFLEDAAAAPGDPATIAEAARGLATAQLDLLHVRSIKRRFWLRLLDHGPHNVGEPAPVVRPRASPGWGKLYALEARLARLDAKADEPLKNLDRLERYERGALAQRKRAGRRFVEALAAEQAASKTRSQ